MNAAVYDATRLTVSGIFRVFYRFRVTGREHVPASGGVILAANHQSYFDPPVIAAAMTRRVAFLAKQELFQLGPFGTYITALGAFPIDRSRGDMAAIRKALGLLAEGHALLMFPEGGRNRDGTAEVKNGVTMLAGLAKVPVLPIGIAGTEATNRFLPIRVAFGEPMQIDRASAKDPDASAEWLARLMAKIYALRETARDN